MASKKRLAPSEEKKVDDDQVIIQPLGAGQEVGRSCIYLKYKGRKILLDCGIHPGMNGQDSLPYFDLIQNEIADVELMLISHFHLDHCGALPWFLQKTPFKGKCYMTHATKATYRWLLSDYVKVSNISADKMLYEEKDIEASMEKIEAINFHQETEVNGIKFWCYNAGHVLGAAMFMIEIAGVKILYTGDFSRQEDRHLMSAELPKVKPDVLIMESTYGTNIHEPREERESRFTGLIHDIISRGGRCLIPVFALGRAQELLLILDEYWDAHPELHEIPIYYASSLAKKCMSVYQTYIHAMNQKIQKQIVVSNPFVFKHISYLRSADHFEDIGPSVVLASPGMMQSGLSRELFETWCTDKRNGVIIAGYCVEGTLAKHILSQPEEIVTMGGQKLPLKSSVDYISFSAHTDYQQSSEFVRALKPTHVVLVHGEQNEMSRLKAALTREHRDSPDYVINIHNPKNGQGIELPFRGEKLAKVVGHLAAKKYKDGDDVSGILVKENFNYRVIAPSDLTSYTNLQLGTVTPRCSLSFSGSFAQLHYHLKQVFGDVEVVQHEGHSQPPRLKVCRAVSVALEKGAVVLEWTSSSMNDMLADGTMIAILTLSPSNTPTNPEIVECTDREEVDFRKHLLELLHDMFGKDCVDPAVQSDRICLVVDNNHITIDTNTLEVTCDDKLLFGMVSTAVEKLHFCVTPLKNFYPSP